MNSDYDLDLRRPGQHRIDDRLVRIALPSRDDPYWLTYAKHHSIGFSKKRAWTWYARFQWPEGAMRKKIIGLTADSPTEKRGLEHLTFDQALGKVRSWCASAEKEGRDWTKANSIGIAAPDHGDCYTVKHAFWDWMEWRRQCGLPLAAQKNTYRRYLDGFLGSLPLNQLEQRDIVRWHGDIAATPAWGGNVRLPHISHAEIGTELFEEIRKRRRTANCHLMALKKALDHAHLHDLIDSNIGWRGIRIYQQIGRYTPLTLEPEEIEALISVLEPPVQYLVEAVWHSGCRIGEIISLTPERIFPDHNKIIVIDSKKRTARGVAIVPNGSQFFKNHGQDVAHGKPIFKNHLGDPWTVQRAGNGLRRELRRLEETEPITFRSIRSSYSGYLIAHGVPASVVARQLGHYSSTTTELYYGHMTDSAIDQVIREKLGTAALVPPS